MRQKEFIEGCYNWYREADLQPGNPDDGEWQECHYPLPKCLGGTETILLLKEHHAVQGILQSEELNRPCIFGWEKDFLGELHLSLWQKWMKIKGQKMVEYRTSTEFRHTDESRERIRKAKVGRNNPMYGKTHSKESRNKIGNSACGKRWWVSESGTTKFQRECPGEGWKQGRNWYN